MALSAAGLLLGLMSTWTCLICPSRGTGETSTAQTTWARLATSTSPSTAARAGPTAAPAPWQVLTHCWHSHTPLLPLPLHTDTSWCWLSHQIVSTSRGREPGPRLISPSSTSSTAATPAAATAGITTGFGNTPANTASQTRRATTTRLKTRVSQWINRWLISWCNQSVGTL